MSFGDPSVGDFVNDAHNNEQWNFLPIGKVLIFGAGGTAIHPGGGLLLRTPTVCCCFSGERSPLGCISIAKATKR